MKGPFDENAATVLVLSTALTAIQAERPPALTCWSGCNHGGGHPPGTLTLLGTGKVRLSIPSLPTAVTIATLDSRALTYVLRNASFVDIEALGNPSDMFNTSAPCSMANSIPEHTELASPLPASSITLIHITVAPGAMPVCVPEVPSPQMMPAQCVPWLKPSCMSWLSSKVLYPWLGYSSPPSHKFFSKSLWKLTPVSMTPTRMPSPL